jgi:hypothetical protein
MLRDQMIDFRPLSGAPLERRPAAGVIERRLELIFPSNR